MTAEQNGFPNLFAHKQGWIWERREKKEQGESSPPLKMKKGEKMAFLTKFFDMRAKKVINLKKF